MLTTNSLVYLSARGFKITTDSSLTSDDIPSIDGVPFLGNFSFKEFKKYNLLREYNNLVKNTKLIYKYIEDRVDSYNGVKYSDKTIIVSTKELLNYNIFVLEILKNSSFKLIDGYLYYINDNKCIIYTNIDTFASKIIGDIIVKNNSVIKDVSEFRFNEIFQFPLKLESDFSNLRQVIISEINCISENIILDNYINLNGVANYIFKELPISAFKEVLDLIRVHKYLKEAFGRALYVCIHQYGYDTNDMIEFFGDTDLFNNIIRMKIDIKPDTLFMLPEYNNVLHGEIPSNVIISNKYILDIKNPIIFDWRWYIDNGYIIDSYTESIIRKHLGTSYTNDYVYKNWVNNINQIPSSLLSNLASHSEFVKILGFNKTKNLLKAWLSKHELSYDIRYCEDAYAVNAFTMTNDSVLNLFKIFSIFPNDITDLYTMWKDISGMLDILDYFVNPSIVRHLNKNFNEDYHESDDELIIQRLVLNGDTVSRSVFRQDFTIE